MGAAQRRAKLPSKLRRSMHSARRARLSLVGSEVRRTCESLTNRSQICRKTLAKSTPKRFAEQLAETKKSMSRRPGIRSGRVQNRAQIAQDAPRNPRNAPRAPRRVPRRLSRCSGEPLGTILTLLSSKKARSESDPSRDALEKRFRDAFQQFSSRARKGRESSDMRLDS